jgi:hypothetical protein
MASWHILYGSGLAGFDGSGASFSRILAFCKGLDCLPTKSG